MRTIHLAVLFYCFPLVPITASPALAAEYALDEAHLRDGWISLFDGTTLFGWQATGKADWRAENGVIAVSHGEVCLLRTTTPFSDFELSLEFRAATTTNSGVFLRSTADPRDPRTDCYELNIAGADNPFPTGSLVAHSELKVPYRPTSGIPFASLPRVR